MLDMTNWKSATMTANGLGQLEAAHFVLVPLVAQGHMIPMVDIARILAERGARVSFITTPVNAARIKTIIDDVKKSTLPIEFVELPFPCAEVGLPEGCENFDLVPSIDLFISLMEGTCKLQASLESHLLAQQQQRSSPTCMITDMCNFWTMSVAQKLRIPRLIFHGPSCLYILSSYLLNKHKVYDRITDPFEPFVVPGLPHELVVNLAQVPGFFNFPAWDRFRDGVWNAEALADGVVINSFDELERDYIECYKSAKGKNIWTIGPLCLHNKDINSKSVRGNMASIAIGQVLGWLEKRKPSSVIYVSFGSIASNTPTQLMEIGIGLEGCNVPFVWVIKDKERTPEVDKWLSDGFEERVSDRGLLIKGWAPQAAILSHPAVGGFMTHCGWNSILEAVSEGLPMVTWPKFADQFINEKLVVEILDIGVAIGATDPSYERGNSPVVIGRKDIEEVVLRLMDESDEGKQRRNRARELGQKAKTAMEDGGSSHANINELIKFACN